MEALRRTVQHRTGAVAFGFSALISCAPNLQAQTRSSEDASPAEIVAARELFRQGTADADAGRFAEGLEKFRRVAAVKETAAVRFNLARCEEALGKTGAALADFELAEREGQDDAKAADVAKLAHDRADALRPRVPRLTLVPPAAAPEGMSVSLDGGKLAGATLGVALPVDPGSHVVDATAPSSLPFHAELTLAAGEAKRVVLSLEPAGSAPRDQPSVEAGSSQRTWGWVTVAAGGLFAVGSGVFLVLHDSAVSTVNADCPSSRCPVSQQPQIQGTELTARNDEAMSVVFIAASALAIGGGVVLLATAPTKSVAATPVAVTTGAPGAPAGLSLRVAF